MTPVNVDARSAVCVLTSPAVTSGTPVESAAIVLHGQVEPARLAVSNQPAIAHGVCVMHTRR